MGNGAPGPAEHPSTLCAMGSYGIMIQTPNWVDRRSTRIVSVISMVHATIIVEDALAIISEDKKRRARLDAEILKEFALLLSPNNNGIPTPEGYPHHRIGLP